MTVETEAVRQLYERITGKSQTVAPSTSADTSESNYVPDVGEATEAPSSKDPDYVPNLGDIIEELLVTQQDDVENFETPLRPETAELLIGGTTRSFRSAHMLKASGDDTRERVIQGILYSKSVTERGPIHITFPRQIRILVESGPDWDYQILVQAEVVPKGMRHTQSWARKAIIGDPARRLALKVTFQPLETINDPVVTYPVNNGEYSVYVANSFVDWLEGKTDEDIANTPRRFLVICGMSDRVPENLRYFRGGGYTDENMRRFKLTHGKGKVYDN
ncbi:hypothetical protein TCE0_033r08632 [Talaromyces pinophilus]|uniref:Uncharacterized protein n=1 Tax=Talaromyces pinophilus TaxID=128442 RepID=A0A6V8HIQ7_TALPI|nr:hypothetical protein TCE0_033r08632 [Talaromyces pinophilus]